MTPEQARREYNRIMESIARMSVDYEVNLDETVLARLKMLSKVMNRDNLSQ